MLYRNSEYLGKAIQGTLSENLPSDIHIQQIFRAQLFETNDVFKVLLNFDH